MKSSICNLLGIKYPILQGGMAWVSEAELAAAVSNAGGLGIIAAGNADASWLEKEIQKVRQLTNKPFGVNVMLLSPFLEDVVKTVCELKVPIVTTGAGNPGKYMELFKSSGIIVIPVVASSAIAKKMQKIGADAVIAEGNESGGHIGKLTTMVFVPQVVDAVDIPVIAAGGIADARGVKAAFALGAVGVQLGTRFICSTECTVHPNYKKAVINAREREAVVTGLSTKHPVRSLENSMVGEYRRLEKNNATEEQLDDFGKGKLRLAAINGDVYGGVVMAGQSSGFVNSINSCSDIIQELITGIPEEFK